MVAAHGVFSGHLALRAARTAAGRTVLREQSFRAPYHVSKAYDAGAALLVNIVNPTAGILAGDELKTVIAVDAGAALLVTCPSATRVFKMSSGSAASNQRFEVGEDAWLEFMPEPLVPHAGSSFSQETLIELAPTAGLFFCETLMPGRLARGEKWSWAHLTLTLSVRRAGSLLLRERFQQSGVELQALSEFGGFSEACFANIVIVSPKLASAPAWRDSIRALHVPGCWVGLTALRQDGAWSLKVIAADSIVLRATLAAVRTVLATVLPGLRADVRRL